MKKVLATVAALGLVLSVAATASALDKPGRASEVETVTAPRVPTATAPGVALWSVAGQWSLAGAYISAGQGALVADVNDQHNESSDDLYIHSFKILPVLQVNDKIAMKGEIRFADRNVFGGNDSGTPNRGDFRYEGGRQIDAYHVYMEWMSPIGKTRFGRTPGGAWGSKFGNNSGIRNRLMLWGNWMPENWGMLMFIQKSAEVDGYNTSSDGDVDHYYLDVSYKADFGKTTIAYLHGRNASSAGSSGQPGSGDDFSTQKLWLTGKYAWDALSLEWEGDINFGECGTRSCDQKNQGFYADLGYNAGDFTFGAKGMYASGDDDWFDSDDESFMGARGLGNDFNPQQIMTGDYMLILNGDNPLTGGGIRTDVQQAGMWGLVGYVNYNASPKLTIRADVGTYSALEELSGYDDSYGTEFGVGMSYKLYDNLTYTAHASFMKTGDFFESDYDIVYKGEEDPYKGGIATKDKIYSGSIYDTEDIFLLAHALTMKF